MTKSRRGWGPTGAGWPGCKKDISFGKSSSMNLRINVRMAHGGAESEQRSEAEKLTPIVHREVEDGVQKVYNGGLKNDRMRFTHAQQRRLKNDRKVSSSHRCLRNTRILLQMPERHGRTFLGRAIKRQADAHMKPRSTFSSQCTTPDHYTRSNDDTITPIQLRVWQTGRGIPTAGFM